MTPKTVMSPVAIVTALAKLEGWQLTGDGTDVAIEKTYPFANYYETMAFVNGTALIAHRQDHHPALTVQYNRCTVRLNTHDVQGLSAKDFDSAARIDALLA